MARELMHVGILLRDLFTLSLHFDGDNILDESLSSLNGRMLEMV